MKVTRLEDGQIAIEMDISMGAKLYESVNKHAVDMTNGALELASLLQEAYYEASHTFRQPPHPFDAQSPRHPGSED